MNFLEVKQTINDDPELRRIAYEAGRAQRAKRAAQPQSRPNREILLEILALRDEQSALWNAEDQRDGSGRIDNEAFRAKHNRIREINGLIAGLQRELSGLQ